MLAITYSDEAYTAVSNFTLPTIQAHFNRQDISLKNCAISAPLNASEHSTAAICWHKLALAAQELPGSEFLIWCDADIYFFKKDWSWKSYVEADPNINVWISSETKWDQGPNGTHGTSLCAGFFILRDCAWTHELLRSWTFLNTVRDEKIRGWNTREQGAFVALWDTFKTVHEHTRLIPESIISNISSTPANVAEAIGHHLWANCNKEPAMSFLMGAEKTLQDCN